MAPEPENKGGGGGGQPSQPQPGGGGGGGGQKKKPYAAETRVLEFVMGMINGLLNAAAFMLIFGLEGFNDVVFTVNDNIYRGMEMFAFPVEIWGQVLGIWAFKYVICIAVGLASQWIVLFLRLTLGMPNIAWIIRLNNIDIGLNVIGLYVIIVEWIGINPTLRDAVRTLVAALDTRAALSLIVVVAVAMGFNSLAEMTTKNARS